MKGGSIRLTLACSGSKHESSKRKRARYEFHSTTTRSRSIDDIYKNEILPVLPISPERSNVLRSPGLCSDDLAFGNIFT